ncbi:MAG: alpha/beta fold hydrolase [Jatrophihabitantaceae bacterium]
MAATYQTVTTGDCRQLEYLSGGSAGGRALLFHVGTPNCATEFSIFREPAEELGLRLICYSRPGYGESTEQPGRTVADTVADAATLLDELGVDGFLTLGWSGGGPHALACAALLPDRCQAAATLAGAGPYDMPDLDFLAGMDEANVEEFSAAVDGFDRLDSYLRSLRDDFIDVSASSVVEGFSGLLSEVDKQALTGQLAEEMAAALRRTMAAGIAGWRDDDLAFVKDWGFRLADITVPVAVWQGRQDRMVPFAHGQWLAAAIPRARPHLFEDQGHISLANQAKAIMADLIELAD